MTRFVVYGEKGGVGKKTCAAATELALADAGHVPLVLSADPTHSLADAFETTLSGEPRQFDECLWLAELDPRPTRTPRTSQTFVREVDNPLVFDNDA